ncbi:hypothetical protein, partial [Phyllobacterium sp. P5_D12]
MFKRLANLLNNFTEKREHRGSLSAVRSFVWSRLCKIRQTIVQTFKRYLLEPLRPFPHRRGVLFVGYVQAGLGLAESLRGMIVAAANQGLEFGIYPYRVGVESRIIGDFMPE